ncbi:MAG TPA: biopolymer transporter ExbD [Terriglobales bacterium]|jgi:biopolymer transport protein ExbD/biopolymer transport protein TolR
MPGFAQRGSGTSLAEINVTPLVDVMLVLLVIFMITAPAIQSGIQISVPKTHNTKQLTQSLLIVNVDRSGNVYIGDKLTNLKTIANDLRQQGAETKSKEIYVRADEHISWGVLARVMDAIKSGGLTSVDLVTEPYDQATGGGGK